MRRTVRIEWPDGRAKELVTYKVLVPYRSDSFSEVHILHRSPGCAWNYHIKTERNP